MPGLSREVTEQREAFEKIKEYLVSPSVLRAPKVGDPFKMYIAAYERVIGAVLLQEEDGKEFPVAYVSRRLLDAETRYVFVDKLRLLYTMLAPSLGITSFLVLA
jgi:hypothetical protein